MSIRLNTAAGLLAALGAGLLPASAAAQTKLLRFPDISGDRVAFCHAGDIWTAPAKGGNATRLTAHPGLELFPKFSPDGKWIAFTGQYEGDEQVYLIPAEGGQPKQLTYYPARGPFPPRGGYDNQVMGWTPDGSAILFRSQRDADGVRSEGQLFTVPAKGGPAKALPMPMAGAGDFSPDGKRIAYSPLFRDFRTWKRYEGGWAQDLYVYDLATNDAKPFATSVRTERDPMWIGDVDLLRLRPRRHAQPVLLGPEDRRGREAHDEHDVGRPLAVVRQRLPHRLRARRRAAGLRRADEGRPGDLDLRAQRRRRHAARPPERREERRGLRAEPEGRAGPLRGPRRRVHAPHREGPHPQPHRHLGRPRQARPLVARRQADRVRVGRVGRGRDLARGPGRRQAGAGHEGPPGHDVRPGVVGRRHAPRLRRQGREALRPHPRRPEGGRGGPRRAGTHPRLRLVAEGGFPRLLRERPERVALDPRLERPRRPDSTASRTISSTRSLPPGTSRASLSSISPTATSRPRSAPSSGTSRRTARPGSTP